MKLFKLFLIIICLQITSSCNSQQGLRGASSNIEESKKNGIFIHEYFVLENPYKINDTLNITIKHIWLEKQWKYGKNFDAVVIDGYQLIVESNEEDIKNIDFEWTIGIDSKKYMRRSSKSDLISDFINIPNDTIIFKVQKGRQLKGDVPKENIIGVLEILKKRK
jgi:hypothetical protein